MGMGRAKKGSMYCRYAPPQSPLVRGGGTTKPRRARGRKAGNVGDRTPGSSIDSPSPSPFSPDTKRPAKGELLHPFISTNQLILRSWFARRTRK